MVDCVCVRLALDFENQANHVLARGLRDVIASINDSDFVLTLCDSAKFGDIVKVEIFKNAHFILLMGLRLGIENLGSNFETQFVRKSWEDSRRACGTSS